jgi:hypothetical protein
MGNKKQVAASLPVDQAAFRLTTEQFASINGIRPQSVRVRLCRTGSYFGVIPRRSLNGRWLWPAPAEASVERAAA